MSLTNDGIPARDYKSLKTQFIQVPQICPHMRIQRGGQGVRTPLKNHKNLGFFSNTAPDHPGYQDSIQCWANIGMPAKRHLNGVSLAHP